MLIPPTLGPGTWCVLAEPPLLCLGSMLVPGLDSILFCLGSIMLGGRAPCCCPGLPNDDSGCSWCGCCCCVASPVPCGT